MELPNCLFSTSPRCTARKKFITVLAERHSLDYDVIGLGNIGKPDGYVRRQVLVWNGPPRR